MSSFVGRIEGMMKFEALSFPHTAFFLHIVAIPGAISKIISLSSCGGGRYPSCFHQLFEAAQVFGDSPLGVFTEEFCDE